jgi:phosphatidylinositol-4,5-bisphosphate 4-phosphatase
MFCNVKFSFDETGQQATVSPIGPDELPPPYTAATQGGVPMVTCRVCQAMIDISGKRDQHVVKCGQCNEATVSTLNFYLDPLL